MADAAALLHRQGGFLHVLEDGTEVIIDATQHETVEERDAALRASAGKNAAGGKEGEIRHRLREALGPLCSRCFRLGLGSGARHARPSLGQRPLARGAISRLEAVFHIPDLLGYGGRGEGAVADRVHGMF